jgi:hypothetical protein
MEKAFSCGKRHMHTAFLTPSLLANLHPHKAFLVVQTCDNHVDLGPDYMGGVGEVQISAA